MHIRTSGTRLSKQLFSATLCLGILMASTPASARVVSLFGPQQFVRAEGKPATIVNTFQVPSDAIGCRLMVRDGAGGPASANNVSVKVNGIEMVNAKTLRNSDPAESEVELQASNILVVTLKGKPGDQVMVSILAEIPDSPPNDPIEYDPIENDPIANDPIAFPPTSGN